MAKEHKEMRHQKILLWVLCLALAACDNGNHGAEQRPVNEETPNQGTPPSNGENPAHTPIN